MHISLWASECYPNTTWQRKIQYQTEISHYWNMHKLELCLNCFTSDFLLNGHQNIILLILNWLVVYWKASFSCDINFFIFYILFSIFKLLLHHIDTFNQTSQFFNFSFFLSVWQIDFKRCTITCTSQWTTYINLALIILRFLWVCVIQKCLSLLCLARNQEYGLVKIDTNKAVKYLFDLDFCTRIAYSEDQKQPLRGIPSKCFSWKSANPWKELVKKSIF